MALAFYFPSYIPDHAPRRAPDPFGIALTHLTCKKPARPHLPLTQNYNLFPILPASIMQ
jgi:hypothetical protein